MDEIETNTDDLTDQGAFEYLVQLVGEPAGFIRYPTAIRAALRRIVSCLDRASPDWPQRVLGLPAV